MLGSDRDLFMLAFDHRRSFQKQLFGASGRDEFEFEYGADFARHVEAFDPSFTKVLVRYNPDGEAGTNARQTARLRRLSDWVVRAITAMQAAGVEADVWKIEGLDERDDCRRVAEQSRSGGRDGVARIVLGRGASAARVAQWLRAGAGVSGYRGFAIGRTIWWDALVGFRDGTPSRAAAASRIATTHLRGVDGYRAAAKEATT